MSDNNENDVKIKLCLPPNFYKIVISSILIILEFVHSFQSCKWGVDKFNPT